MNIKAIKNGKTVFTGDLMHFLTKYNFNFELQNECIKLRHFKQINFVLIDEMVEGSWTIEKE